MRREKDNYDNYDRVLEKETQHTDIMAEVQRPRSAIIVGMFLYLEFELFILLSEHMLTSSPHQQAQERAVSPSQPVWPKPE